MWSRFPHTLLTWFSSMCHGKRKKDQHEPPNPRGMTFFTLERSTDFIVTAHKGGQDKEEGLIRLWDLGSIEHVIGSASFGGSSNRSMISLLSAFISFKSISQPENAKVSHSPPPLGSVVKLNKQKYRVPSKCEVTNYKLKMGGAW